ncbi:MAG TPA: DUF502 domain-containing protein [Verrucomicrobiae bacterium]|nr:DUF502 domain-containing protein [Verrucomicrobiae bacterium]
MNTDPLVRWRQNFFAGLFIVLPGVVSFGFVVWLFFKITDTLLFFIPKSITHANDGAGDLFWYWRVVALVVAIVVVSVAGLLGRNYLGKRFLEAIDAFLCSIPLFNKIYGTTKQVNEAFASGNKTAFKTVVMIEYPRPGVYSVGFLTSELNKRCEGGLPQDMVCVFIPTTPNPTSGFLVLVPQAEVVKLDMSVAEGFKFIVSLGAISPDSTAMLRPAPAPVPVEVPRPK